MISLIPDFYFENAADIKLKFLQKYCIRAVLLDIDNTLSRHGENIPYDSVIEWISLLEKSGIKVGIISNNKEERVCKFAKILHIKYYVSNASKPYSSGFYKALDILKVDKEYVLLVGDQIFTDILGAKLVGIKSVLVEAKDKNEPISIKIKRGFEIPIKILIKAKCKNRRIIE